MTVEVTAEEEGVGERGGGRRADDNGRGRGDDSKYNLRA